MTARVNHMRDPDQNLDQAERETPVITYPGPKFPFVGHAGNPLAGRPRAQPATADTATKISPGAGLLLSLILSLGLWAVIWPALSSMAAAWLG